MIHRYISAAMVADYYEQGWTVRLMAGWHGARNRWIAWRDE